MERCSHRALSGAIRPPHFMPRILMPIPVATPLLRVPSCSSWMSPLNTLNTTPGCHHSDLYLKSISESCRLRGPFKATIPVASLPTMSITIDKILAANPATTRGQPTHLSCDPKGERIAYAVSCYPLDPRTPMHPWGLGEVLPRRYSNQEC